MSGPRNAHIGVLLGNGKVLVAGGVGPGYLRSAELYDPTSGTWQATGSLSQSRDGYALVLQNGMVLYVGGWGGGCLATAELYNPASGTWSSAGSMSSGRCGPVLALLNDGRALAAGSAMNSTGTDLFSPSSGTWASSGTLHEARGASPTVVLANGKVLTAVGYYYGPSALETPSSAELFDPTSGTWSLTGAPSGQGNGVGAVRLLSGKVLAVGFGTSAPAAVAEIYDPSTATWTSTAALASPRMGGTVTLLTDGTALSVGGFVGDYLVSQASSAAVELYVPETGQWVHTN